MLFLRKFCEHQKINFHTFWKLFFCVQAHLCYQDSHVEENFSTGIEKWFIEEEFGLEINFSRCSTIVVPLFVQHIKSLCCFVFLACNSVCLEILMLISGRLSWTSWQIVTSLNTISSIQFNSIQTYLFFCSTLTELFMLFDNCCTTSCASHQISLLSCFSRV